MAESIIGKLCIKIAGRDAGQVGVIVEDLGKGFLLIDGSTRRRKCNEKHLEILDKNVDLKKGASHEDVVAALKAIGVTVIERKKKEKSEKKQEKKEEKKPAKKAKAKK